MIKPLYIKDRENKEYKIYPARLKALKNVSEYIPKINDLLFLYKTFDETNYSFDEQIIALRETLKVALKYSGAPPALHKFDIWMGKQAATYFIGHGSQLGIHLSSGTLIKDRFSHTHKVYSYLLNDYQPAMHLLKKIDMVNITANFDDPLSSKAVEDIIYAAVNGVDSYETIRTYADAAFFQQVLSIYYDIK